MEVCSQADSPMKIEHLKYLVCPHCHGPFLLGKASIVSDGRVERGSLECTACPATFAVVDFIPRIVTDRSNYTDDFGFQWNKHYRTQYDSYSGLNISRHRFFDETQWPEDMRGQLLLEAGSGSGRFTEHACSTGAMVVSFDYSNAVEANYRNNGARDNLLIVQASIYAMPFRQTSFDKVVCIGVLQHTPDPKKSFLCLAAMLRSGGQIVVDAYQRLPGWRGLFETKYWVRPITRRIGNRTLYRMCEFWVNLMWPVTRLAYRLTGRRTLSWLILIADYRGVYPLSESMLKEWSILDTFDMLAPEYDFPQTIASVTDWFDSANLTQVDIKRGYNGIQGVGTKQRYPQAKTT